MRGPIVVAIITLVFLAGDGHGQAVFRERPWEKMVDVSEADFAMAYAYTRQGYIADGHWETCPPIFGDTARVTFCEKMILPDLTQNLTIPREACVILWILRSHTVCLPPGGAPPTPRRDDRDPSRGSRRRGSPATPPAAAPGG